MPVLPYLHYQPQLGEGVALAGDAVVVGAVAIVGPARFEAAAVARGDQSPIVIGQRFRIGRRSTVHVEAERWTWIGSDVWVGDGAVVHACVVGDGVRVEDGALVLSGSAVGAGSIVAAGSLVPEKADFPANSYISGTPGRRLRDTTPAERQETLAALRAALSY